jgi:hypothetical protein
MTHFAVLVTGALYAAYAGVVYWRLHPYMAARGTGFGTSRRSHRPLNRGPFARNESDPG